MKYIRHNEDWLAKIDGMTVEDAIKYLSGFPKTYRLEYTLEGDTHEVDLNSYLYEDVKETELEYLHRVVAHNRNEVKLFSNALQHHIKNGHAYRIPSCQNAIDYHQGLADEAQHRIDEILANS